MIRDGSMFEQWKSTIENGFGYSVKSEVLHSHNHGDAQSRKRLFIMGRWNYQPEFPEPTHSKTGKEPGMMAYRSAKEIIDWDDHGESIWNRSNPLCLNTNRKMAKGIKEFGMESLHPYADVLSELTPEKIKEMKENAVPVSKAEEEAANRDDPFLVEVPKEEGDPHLILSANEFNAGICSTYTEREDQEPRVRDPNRPLMTIPATKNPARIEQPFLIKYYGKSAEADVNKSMPTITTKSSMGLIIPELYPWGVDIRHRLLKPREAARAQGFPESYEFATEKKTTKRKLIGNAVPINTARALSRKLLEPTDAPTFNKFKGGGQSTTSVQAQKNEAGS